MSSTRSKIKSLDATGTSLWTVGARRIYRLSLDGQVQERDFKGDDLEGTRQRSL